jgi:hypothetical protein
MSSYGPDDRTNGLNILIKAMVTGVTGGVAYLITNLADQPQIWGLTLSAFIGGVTLVIQFLIDFENRLKAVEDRQSRHATKIERLVREGFSKINEATELFGLVEASAFRTDVVTQLVRHSTQIDPGSHPLIYDFAQTEITRMSEFLKELSEGGDVTYDGEDRDWLLALARNTRSTIDATSLSMSDSDGNGQVDEGLWNSDLGQRYLEAQRDAVDRGVAIRRVFILDRPELARDPNVRKACELQQEIGIEVRLLDPAAIPGKRRSSVFDFVVFDGVISYELVPASKIGIDMGTVIANTRLVLRPHRVAERIQGFKDLWAAAKEMEPLAAHSNMATEDATQR